MENKFISICGTVCDLEVDNLISKVVSESMERDKFFLECLYKNYEGLLYLYITWGKCSNSPAKTELIKMYELKEAGEFICIVSKEECKTWLRCHDRYEDIEFYISVVDME